MSRLMTPTHAGGIVYRKKNGTGKYLLVRPRKNRKEWVFPKGRIERGERDIDAAIREVEEETGVVAKKIAVAGTSVFDNGKRNVRSVFYLMQYTGKGVPTEKRKTRWVSYSKAAKLLTHDGNLMLLQAAEKIRKKRKKSSR